MVGGTITLSAYYHGIATWHFTVGRSEERSWGGGQGEGLTAGRQLEGLEQVKERHQPGIPFRLMFQSVSRWSECWAAFLALPAPHAAPWKPRTLSCDRFVAGTLSVVERLSLGTCFNI